MAHLCHEKHDDEGKFSVGYIKKVARFQSVSHTSTIVCGSYSTVIIFLTADAVLSGPSR